MARPTYVRLMPRGASILLTGAVILKCLTLILYLVALSHRNGWAESESTSSSSLITYKGKWGLFVVHFEGIYKAGGITATYKSTEPISNWAHVAGANSTVIHKVRTVQAFSIIGGVVKIMGTLSFVSGRFAARTASQALQLLDKGRALNLAFLFCNILVTSIWASLPESAFFWFCNVYPQQEGQSSCISTHFQPPLGNSSWTGRSYSYDLVVAASVCAIIAAIASALARRPLRRLAEEERLGDNRGGGGMTLGGAAILDLDQPLMGGGGNRGGGGGGGGGGNVPVSVVVDPSAPPSSKM